jgi:WhiB family redox-sensing transcriptional regulator
MDLSALITRGFAISDQILWLLVVGEGACSTSRLSPDDWYPVSASAEVGRREAAEAIAVCAACQVREQCLELALRNWAVGQHGVWGGTVPAERERLRATRVAQLTRVLARNRYADLAATRNGDREASLSPAFLPTTTSSWPRLTARPLPRCDSVRPHARTDTGWARRSGSGSRAAHWATGWCGRTGPIRCS